MRGKLPDKDCGGRRAAAYPGRSDVNCSVAVEEGEGVFRRVRAGPGVAIMEERLHVEEVEEVPRSHEHLKQQKQENAEASPGRRGFRS